MGATMTEDLTHVEASLLYPTSSAPFGALDAEMLRSAFERLGAPVRVSKVLDSQCLLLLCDRFWVAVSSIDTPLALDTICLANRGGAGDDPHVWEALARHRSCLSVGVGTHDGEAGPDERAMQNELCLETVDLILSVTEPELVHLPRSGEILTLWEAQERLDGGWNDVLPDMLPPKPARRATPRPASVAPAGAFKPRANVAQPAHLPPLSVQSMILPPTYAEAICLDAIRPRRPQRPAQPTPRPPHLVVEPELSQRMETWLEDSRREPTSADLAALRAFFALDDSPEPRRLADTASGRASLYIMSATIGVFALPVGAAVLTYNALSGGSFRATAHAMALTGMFLAMAAAGMPTPADALALRF